MTDEDNSNAGQPVEGQGSADQPASEPVPEAQLAPPQSGPQEPSPPEPAPTQASAPVPAAQPAATRQAAAPAAPPTPEGARPLAKPSVPRRPRKRKRARGKIKLDKPNPSEVSWGTGRRKSAVARVRLWPGDGRILINGRELEDYFSEDKDRRTVKAPLEATKSLGRYTVSANVTGGGFTGQAGAVVLGIARALRDADEATFATLRDNDFLTRDGRMKERKKYGQRGARRRFQFSKR